MDNIIEIKETDKGQAVSARNLHEKLGIKSNFSTWFKRMLEYGFIDGIDFIPFLEKSSGGRRKKDFVLTIESAKQIAMIQRNDIGKRIRLYLIDCEKAIKKAHGLSLEEKQGLFRTNQVNGTYGVKDYLINRFGKDLGIRKFIEWSKYSHQVITGRTIKQTKKLGIEYGLKSKERRSAKEVCRNIEPYNGFGHYIADLAATISGDAKLAASMGKEAATHLMQKQLPIKRDTKEIIPF